MILDFCGCWIVEAVLKRAFSDYKPKDIALRRPDQLAKEEARKKVEWEAAMRKREKELGKI